MPATLSITGTTRVYGVIADPIAHVRAPMVFNPLFEQKGTDAVMVPVHAPADRLETVLDGLKAQPNFGGLAVTVPHKLAIMELCDEVGRQGRLVGAVNAVRFDEKRQMIGDNFDGAGFVAGMRAEGHEVTGRSVLQIVVNTTSAGLHDSDPLPINRDFLVPGLLVAEIIMIPERTALLESALERGCKIQFGRHMLDKQIDLIGGFLRCFQ